MSPHRIGGPDHEGITDVESKDISMSQNKPSQPHLAVVKKKVTQTVPQPSPPSIAKPIGTISLEVLFNNRTLLSSFIRNFERKDYRFLSQLAASMPGSLSWPGWDPLTQPWPLKLPFDIRDFPVSCQNIRPVMRKLIDLGPTHSGMSRWK
jgi:hypothetical protein